MKKALLFSCIAGTLLLVVPAQLQAQQGGQITFGNLSIIPSIAVQGIHDDNIYLGNGQETQAETKVSDWITHVKPGLLFSYQMPERGFINLGYQGDFAFYKDNSNNNWKNNQGLFNVDYQAPGGLIVGINELYGESEDPYGDANQYNVGRVTKRWSNDLKTKVGFTVMSNFRSFLYFNHYKQKYKDIQDYSQDYTDMEYGIGAETRFLPKSWGFLRYHYGTRKYNTTAPGGTDAFNADAAWHRVNAGLTWDPGAKLSGELNLGYQWRKYDHQLTSAAQRREDKDTWIAATSVTFMPAEGTSIAMNLTRAVRSTSSDTNEQFIDTGIGISVQQKLLTKLSLNAGVNYSKNEYNLPVGKERSDNNYLANISLDYNIQEWLTISAGYNFNQKNSNVPEQEFTDNQFMAQLKIVY